MIVKAEIKVKPEQLEDVNGLVSYLQSFVGKINNDYGRNLSLHSWQIDEKEGDDERNVKTVELSLK